MKITKRQLRSIIAEEKQKIISENSPAANAERMQGLYSDMTAISVVEKAIADLMAGTDGRAFQDLLDEEEADEAAVAAVVLTVADALQALGMFEQYNALLKTLK
jgi:hypothetical protein